jgi:hypothetical protein
MINWSTKDWLLAAGIGGVGILAGIIFSRSKPLPGRTTLLPPAPALRGLGRMPEGYEIPRETHCGCEIRHLKSKGGSTRYAAVCPSSPIPRYVKKDFAEKVQGKTFCTDLLKPFSPLSGRWAANRRWGPYYRHVETLRRAVRR